MSRKLSIAILILIGLCVTIGKSYACGGGSSYPVAVLDVGPVVVDVNATLDGSGSFPVIGTITKYEWDWTNDGTYDYNETSGSPGDGFDGITTHIYDTAGTYSAKLRVTNSYNYTDIDTCTVYVKESGYCYVDQNGDDDADGLSWATAFATVQRGINVSGDGFVVEVNEGTYYENVTFGGYDITLTSTDPNDPDVIAATVIDADSSTFGIHINNGESSDCLITGFTITNGNTGVLLVVSSATITKCFIKDNYYYGIACALAPSPVIRNNWIYDNDIGINFDSADFSGTICNNTIVDNTSFGINGTSGSSAIITNCILWNNDDDLSDCTATYSCIEGGTGTNISGPPDFADYDNDDFHLNDDSPCIDVGDPDGTYTGQTDIDGEARVINGRVDIGADEFLNIIYVDKDAPVGTNNGTSWSKAYKKLQDALAVARAGDEVWVAEGTYNYDNLNSNREQTFLLNYEFAVYGGFDATETARSQRDWKIHQTILDGKSAAFHVVTSTANATLDGFTIQKGRALNYQGPFNTGRDRGAGLLIISSMTVNNCIFYDNAASWKGYGGGGAIYIPSGGYSPTIKNSLFHSNNATIGGNGGAILSNASLTIINCVFYNNEARNYGGAINGWGGGVCATCFTDTITITNCTFVNNSAQSGGGAIALHNDRSNSPTSNAIVKNCILYDNGSCQIDIRYEPNSHWTGGISYSCVEGGAGSICNQQYDTSFVYDSSTNVTGNPNFLIPSPSYNAYGTDGKFGTSDDGFMLANVSSSCVDKGYDTAITELYDVTGNTRKVDGDEDDTITVDIGAYEYQP